MFWLFSAENSRDMYLSCEGLGTVCCSLACLAVAVKSRIQLDTVDNRTIMSQ